MSLGSLYCMPIIVLNMGGEMIYILNQRLQAQNIPPEKARKVLGDVVRTMYTSVFLDELFKPQEMYSVSSTKQIFDKLAHSSIMRLNKTSMDKLFDLMTMGVKHQLLSCKCPQQFLQVTLNHLDTLIEMVQCDGVSELVHVAIGKCIELYSAMRNGHWLLLEETLLQFFQGKKIKVSLFLQRNLQTMTGALVLSNCGVLPYGTELPGEVRFFEGSNNNNNNSSSDNSRLLRVESFHSRIRDVCVTSDEVLESNWLIGTNIYQRDNSSTAANAATPGPTASSATAGAKGTAADSKSSSLLLQSTAEAARAFARSVDSPGAANAMPKSPAAAIRNKSRSSKFSSQASAKAELTLLSDLLGVGSNSNSNSSAKTAETKGAATAGDRQLFRINLFPNSDFQSKEDSAVTDSSSSSGGGFITLDIDGAAGAKTISTYEELLDWKDDYSSSTAAAADAKHGSSGDDDDDLLALMDSAK